jgi:hypothetical protein
MQVADRSNEVNAKSVASVLRTRPGQVFQSVRQAMELAGWRERLGWGVDVSLKVDPGWCKLIPGAARAPWVVEGMIRPYLRQYLPERHPLYEMSESSLPAPYCGYPIKIDPESEPSWVEDYYLHRDRSARPICAPRFSEPIPRIQTPIGGSCVTDSSQLHSGDRTLSGNTCPGRRAAGLMLPRRECQ